MREQNDGGGGDDDDDDINCGSILANTIFKGDAHAFTSYLDPQKVILPGFDPSQRAEACTIPASSRCLPLKSMAWQCGARKTAECQFLGWMLLVLILAMTK